MPSVNLWSHIFRYWIVQQQRGVCYSFQFYVISPISKKKKKIKRIKIVIISRNSEISIDKHSLEDQTIVFYARILSRTW